MKQEHLSEKEKAIECLKALSRIEGYVFSVKDNEEFLGNNLEYLVKYFDDLLKEMDK